MSIYTDLITSEHADRPNFVATVKTTTDAGVKVSNLIAGLPESFDVDVAIGVQLDAIGKWVGRSRRIETPLAGVYFVLDGDPGLDVGVWQGEFDPSTGMIDLDDESYRTLLKAKIAANSWNGTIPGAYDVWQSAFNDGSIIIVQDNQDMSMVVGIAGVQQTAVMQALLTNGYLALKPAGVRINYFAISSEAGPIFALDCDSPALAGCDLGSWAVELPAT